MADASPGSLEEWTTRDELPPLNAFTAGQVQYRPPFTAELAGTRLDLIGVGDEAPVLVEFLDGETIRYTLDGLDPLEGRYGATPIRPGIYLVDTLVDGWPADGSVPGKPVSVTWALDLDAARATAAVSFARTVPYEGQGALLRATTRHLHYTAPGGAGAHPRSSGMVGHRVYWRYSETDHYDHIYLNAGNFAWQCVRGVERGMSEMDRSRAYEVADGLYFFHWSEHVFVVESALFVDLRDLRTSGRFFGVDAADASILHHQFGAYGQLLNTTEFPDPESGPRPA